MKYILFIVGLISLIVPIVEHYRKPKKKTIPATETEQPNTNLQRLQVDKLKECLDMNNMWIDNCDQKAGLLLATMGVALTVFMTSDSIKVIRHYIFLPFLQWWNNSASMEICFSRLVVFVFLLTTAAFGVFSMLKLLNTIKPNIDYDDFYKKNPDMARKSFIFYGTVAKMPYTEFRNTQIDYENDLRSQVYTNAMIAKTKFDNYLEGFFWFKMMMLSASFLIISTMLMQ